MANIKETDMSDMSKQQVWIVKHKLNESQRYYVLPRYRSRKKSKVVAYLLWLPFGLHYFYPELFNRQRINTVEPLP